MLRQRLPMGIALILALIGVIWVDSKLKPWHPIWHALVLSAGMLATNELGKLLEQIIARPFRVLMILSVGGCLLANAFVPIKNLVGMAALGPAAATFVVFLVFLLLTGVKCFDDSRPVLPRVVATLFGVAYIGLLGSFLTLLRLMFESSSGPFALYLVVAATKGTDTGAYTFGKLLGRHLMTPRLSPKKTWEGAAGGVLFAIGLTFLVQSIEEAITGTRLLTSVTSTLLFAISISIAGQLGDLAESLIKREARTKDASSSLPGFGGVLDLLDSLLLAAPVGWFFLHLPYY